MISFEKKIVMKNKRILFLLVTILFAASVISCKSTRRKNRCNTCPTWDQIDISQDTHE